MPGLGELIVITMILVMLGLTGVWIWMIVDCATNEPPQDKTTWLLLTILTGLIGALIYLLYRRPKRRTQYGR